MRLSLRSHVRIPGSILCDTKNPQIKAVAHVWGSCPVLQVDEQALHTALTTRAIETVGERIVKALSKDAAIESRDSLAKNLYARMFDWMVAAVNRKISALGAPPLVDGVFGILSQ